MLPDTLTAEGEGKGAYNQFKAGETVQVKVASSYISTEQAELNLQSKIRQCTVADHTIPA